MSESALPVRSPSNLKKIAFDEVSAALSYLGTADPGVPTSAAAWRIQRITTTGPLILIEFADGNAEMDNVWDDRATLTYS